MRCLRLDRIAFDDATSTSRLKSLTLNMTQIEEEDKGGREIHIPRVEDLFKNQSKEIHIYENTTLRDRLGKMIHNLDQGIAKFKSLTFAHARAE